MAFPRPWQRLLEDLFSVTLSLSLSLCHGPGQKEARLELRRKRLKHFLLSVFQELFLLLCAAAASARWKARGGRNAIALHDICVLLR